MVTELLFEVVRNVWGLDSGDQCILLLLWDFFFSQETGRAIPIITMHLVYFVTVLKPLNYKL